MKDDIQKPKSLSQRITAATLFINKTAYKTGLFLYGATNKKNPNPTISPHRDSLYPQHDSNSDKCDLPLDRLHPEDAAQIERETLFEHTPTAHDKQEDEFTKGLIKIEYELETMRKAWTQAQDDIDRNALRFKVLRLERTRHEYLTKKNKNN